MSERYPHLKANDPEVYDLIQRQAKLESTTLKMIASESYASLDVLKPAVRFLRTSTAKVPRRDTMKETKLLRP